MMNNPKHAESAKVSLEELLRLKRAERPSPEFWESFERDLRAKQLAAIVEPRPWWVSLRLPQAARSVARFQVPMGALAVLALSFVVVREYRPVEQRNELVAPPAEAPVVLVAVANPVDAAPEIPKPLPAVSVAEAESLSAVHAANVASSEPETQAKSGELLAMIPWAAPQVVETVGVATAGSPAVVDLPQVHFASAVNLNREIEFKGRVEVNPAIGAVASNKPAVSETRAYSTPVSKRELRRSRILSDLSVADNSAELDRSRLAQAREVIVSSLDEDRLYESVQRVGMGGDRLTLKF